MFDIKYIHLLCLVGSRGVKEARGDEAAIKLVKEISDMAATAYC